VLAFALWFISVIVKVLLIAGAIALVVGLVWFIARHVSAARESSALSVAEAGEAAQAAPPQAQYHPVVSIDPSVFDDPTRAEVAALDAFRAWARQLPSAPRDPRDAVRAMKMRTRLVGRLVSECAGRHVVWRSEPYSGRKRPIEPPVQPESVAPWTVEVERLRQESRHIATCDGCLGKGRVDCDTCGGSGRVGCSGCQGHGKVWGTTSAGQQRLLNCKWCRGRGDVVCRGCTRGRVICPLCEGSKKLERWLDVEESTRWDIQIEPDGEITRAFRWGADGVPASDAEVEADAKVLARVRSSAVEASNLAGMVPDHWIEQHWPGIQPTLQPGERIRSQQFTLLEVPAVEVTYTLDNQIAQTIDFEGLRMLAPPARTDRLFHQRAARLKAIRRALAVVPAVLAILYLARGSNFHSVEVVGLIACLAASCIGVYGALWAATLGRRTARLWLPGVILPLIGGTALAFMAEPSAGTVRGLIAAGEYEAARRELAALGGPGDPRLAPLYADMQLGETLQAQDWSAAKALAARIPEGTPQRARATAHVDALLRSAIQAALQLRQFTEARRLLDETSRELASGPEGRDARKRIELGWAEDCLRAENWTCALERAAAAAQLGGGAEAEKLRVSALSAIETKAADLAKRAAQERERSSRISLARQADALWALWLAQTGAEPTRNVLALRESLAKDEAAQAKEDARRRAREEKQRLREERQQKREEERRQRAERRRQRALAPLLCADGTLSSTCTCGRSHRGCCSHHGGVAGCSR